MVSPTQARPFIPTIRLLAERCNVSRNTVSLALKGDPRISAAVTRTILRTANEVGYTPDPRVSLVMSQIARKNKPDRGCIAALLGPYYDRPDPWETCPVLGSFLRELSDQAEKLAYRIVPFWLGEKGMTPRRMRDILKARGISGIIVLADPETSAVLDFDFSEFATAVIGHISVACPLDTISANLHGDVTRAMEEVTRRGYLTPGLAMDSTCSEHVMRCWKASYFCHDPVQPEDTRIPPCIYSRSNLGHLREWLKQYQPDVVLGRTQSTYQDLIALGVNVPDEVGFVSLLHDGRYDQISGIGLQHKAIARKAVNLVSAKLCQFEFGVPATPELVLYDGTWTEGTTLPERSLRRSA